MTEWIVTSSAMILIVIALRGLLKGKISLKLQYSLWALVLVRLLLPFSIVDSAISISNVLSAPVIREADDAVADYETAYQSAVQRHESSGTEYTDTEIRQQVQQELYDRTYTKLEQEYAQSAAPVPQIQIQAEAQQQVEVISLTAVITEALPYFWVAGMIAVAAVLVGSNLHFGWKLRKSRTPLHMPDVPLKVYLTDYVATPCLFGAVKPDIYLTNEVMKDPQMQRHVLAHEMSHFRQGDHIWSVLRCVCLVLHWYNPLVWVAAILSKQDAELACDEATIKALGEAERVAYGRTLIGMTCVRRDPRSMMLTATTMLGTKKTLKERVALIAKKPKTALYTLIACVLVVSLAVGCTFTGAPAETKTEEEKLLDRCREAVEYIQNLEHFEITEHYEIIEESDYVFGHSPVEVRYVHSSDDWYHTRITPDWTWQFLEKDGQQFRKDITNAVPEEDNPTIEWTQVNLSENLHAKHAWIMDLHWGEDAIEFLTYTGNGDGYEGGTFTPLSVSSATEGSVELITVELEFGAEQTVNDIEQGALWILTFRFDLYSGDVTEVKREIVMEDREVHVAGINGGTEHVDFRSTSTLTIYPGTEEEMSAIIDGIYYDEIVTVIPTPEDPTTEPTEPPVKPVLNWELPDYPQLSYDEYFSETRYYYYAAQGENPKQQYYWGGWNNGKDKCEVWMEDGKILAGSSITGKYVQVGTETYENTRVTCCDEFWIYAIKDRTELFRIDYNGENRQTLYVDETQKIAPFDITYTHVRDNSVLFFVAAAGSDYGIYRLYLPDMTLDLLYTTESKPFLYEPYSNYEITWSSDVNEVVNNVYEIDYYYNCLTGELLERPVYGDRSWGNTTWAWWEEMIEPTEPLSLVEQFQELLTYENGYWYWRAMGCIFDEPEDISLYDLFYNGLKTEERQDRNTYTDNEVAFLQDLALNTFGAKSLWVNAHKMPREYISDVLNDYFGLDIDDVTIPEEWTYFEETDAYYCIRSDGYGVSGQTVTEVQTSDNGLVYVYWTANYLRDTRYEETSFINEPEMVLVLQEKADGGYLVLANVIDPNSLTYLLQTSDLGPLFSTGSTRVHIDNNNAEPVVIRQVKPALLVDLLEHLDHYTWEKTDPPHTDMFLERIAFLDKASPNHTISLELRVLRDGTYIVRYSGDGITRDENGYLYEDWFGDWIGTPKSNEFGTPAEDLRAFIDTHWPDT